MGKQVALALGGFFIVEINSISKRGNAEPQVEGKTWKPGKDYIYLARIILLHPHGHGDQLSRVESVSSCEFIYSLKFPHWS